MYHPAGGISGGGTTGSTPSTTGVVTTGGGTTGGYTGPLTPTEIQSLLNVHNAARAEVCVSPIQWDNTLAQVAQNWANKCVFQHNQGRTTDYANLGGSGYVGENIAMGMASFYSVGGMLYKHLTYSFQI